MKNYLKLIRFVKGHEKLFGLVVVTMVISSFFEVFQLSLFIPMVDIIFTHKKIIVPSQLPGFIAAFVDKLNAIPPEEMLRIFPFAVVGLMILKNIFSLFHLYFMSDISQKIMRDIRYRLYEKIQNLSLDYFSKKRTGELISRITNDVNVIENAVSYGITDLFRQTFIIILCLINVFVVYPVGAGVIFAVFPLIGIPMYFMGKRLKKISRSVQEKMADITSFLIETISGIKIVKAFHTEKYETERFKKQNHEYYKLRMKSVKRIIVMPTITEMVGVVSGLSIVVLLGHKVLNNELSFGVFIYFFGSFMTIISPIKKLGNVNALTQQALAANERIYDVLESKPTVYEKSGAIDLPTVRDNIVIDKVEFQYDAESGLVLKDVSLEVKRGELVAIVGPTGSGKTTMVNLIPRFYDPLRGTVKIDGCDLKNVTFASLRKQVGVVTQETILFNDTVRANIAYGRFDASQEEIEHAAKSAFAHQFIKDMPQGYDTVVGDRGFRLSGGEKQRISIARAILKNAPILILDEATSQLDSASEKFVQDALDKLMEGRTVVAIAHRLSTIIKADKIVVLEKGRIVGQGRHEELLKTCSLYKKLYDMQFEM